MYLRLSYAPNWLWSRMALLLKCGCIALYTTQVPAQLSLRPCINLPLEFQSRDHFQKKREAQFMFLSDWPFLFTGCDLIIRYRYLSMDEFTLGVPIKRPIPYIIQWKLFSCFDELNLLLCWFWFDHMLQLFDSNQEKYLPEWIYQQFLCSFFWRNWNGWIKENISMKSLILWDMSTLWSHSKRRQLY